MAREGATTVAKSRRVARDLAPRLGKRAIKAALDEIARVRDLGDDARARKAASLTSTLTGSHLS
jgi:hypothetical protein